MERLIERRSQNISYTHSTTTKTTWSNRIRVRLNFIIPNFGTKRNFKGSITVTTFIHPTSVPYKPELTLFSLVPSVQVPKSPSGTPTRRIQAHSRRWTLPTHPTWHSLLCTRRRPTNRPKDGPVGHPLNFPPHSTSSRPSTSLRTSLDGGPNPFGLTGRPQSLHPLSTGP